MREVKGASGDNISTFVWNKNEKGHSLSFFVKNEGNVVPFSIPRKFNATVFGLPCETCSVAQVPRGCCSQIGHDPILSFKLIFSGWGEQ